MGSLKTPRYTCPGKGILRESSERVHNGSPVCVRELFIFHELDLALKWEAAVWSTQNKVICMILK